eukprot:CAMPEP_0177592378 /NCGR_PEP_ID=MMETSP0419_2-20121207/8528_1 /TAXON_ID=582737 /ORGANISM="Tetraselmis sp., Strain GSL018" /LENGTH=491 /DNA_ID=CAMNT_0019083241 /DNA_START=542 /DNA_END=2016 /DNA_ORIENTATION=+
MGSEFQRSTAENACAPDRPVSARCLRSPWEHRNSPRTLQASVSSGSPIAKQLHIPSAWLASEEEATPVPVTPSLQYNSHEETPPRTNSPYAAADDPYYAVSPILFPHGINSESAEDRPASPGGYSKARRRQVLGNKSRFQGEGIPTASPVSFSGSPVNARCAWKQGRGTFRPSLGSLRDGQLRITGWAKGPLTSGESCSDQLIEAFGCDELLPKPNFSMAREMLGHQSPQGSPSSVGSLPIEYDEEEYGFDRDIDYSQFDHLVALMPPAQFTIPKPSLATPEAAVFYEQHQELDPCRQSSGELEGTRAPDKGDDRKRWPDHTQRRLFVSRSPRRSPLRRHWRRKGPVGVSRFRRAAEAQAPVDEGQRERRYGQGAKPFVGEAASERETSGPVPSSRGRPKDPRGSSEACGPEPPSAAPPARVLPSAMRARRTRGAAANPPPRPSLEVPRVNIGAEEPLAGVQRPSSAAAAAAPQTSVLGLQAEASSGWPVA